VLRDAPPRTSAPPPSRAPERPFGRPRVDAASSHVKQAVRTQGEAVTEKVADAVKERLFGAPASQPTTVDAQATSSTTQR